MFKDQKIMIFQFSCAALTLVWYIPAEEAVMSAQVFTLVNGLGQGLFVSLWQDEGQYSSNQGQGTKDDQWKGFLILPLKRQ